jgi:hypothetical protein
MLSPDDQDAAAAAIETAIAARRAEGDEQVALIRFDWQPVPEDLGCDWHPSAVAQARMADEFERRIREDLEWESSN